MSDFRLAVAVSPIALSLKLATVDRDTSQSHTVFFVLVGLAAIGWLFAMVGLAGGWKRLPASMQSPAKVKSVAAMVVLGVIGILIVHMYRPRTVRAPTRARIEEHERVERTVASLPSPRTESPVGSQVMGTANNRSAISQPVRAEALASPSKVSRERTSAQAAQPETYGAKTQIKDETSLRRGSNAALESTSKRTSIILHGASLLSEPQAKRVCNAVSLYAGAQVYIKWSPGANAEALASQLSQAMDCARVTVTYASAVPGLPGHGVRVGTHANEGETSDRIRPFADAITAALRAQGFKVSEVTGGSIPADQTAIFIGPD